MCGLRISLTIRLTTSLTGSGVAGYAFGFQGVNLGFPPCDGAMVGAGAQGYLGAVVGDAEVGCPRRGW